MFEGLSECLGFLEEKYVSVVDDDVGYGVVSEVYVLWSRESFGERSCGLRAKPRTEDRSASSCAMRGIGMELPVACHNSLVASWRPSITGKVVFSGKPCNRSASLGESHPGFVLS